MFHLFLSFLCSFTLGPSAHAAPEALQIKLSIQNGKFIPSMIKAPANTRIELFVENKGPGAEEFESKELRREKVIPEGQTVKIIIGGLPAGEYPFFGEYHSESAQGKLVIE